MKRSFLFVFSSLLIFLFKFILKLVKVCFNNFFQVQFFPGFLLLVIQKVKMSCFTRKPASWHEETREREYPNLYLEANRNYFLGRFYHHSRYFLIGSRCLSELQSQSFLSCLNKSCLKLIALCFGCLKL